ncbi:MAG: hypothetical protein RMM98_11515, partial [Acidobacteriota bacterium]|nr:hypothetical protein [Acidobacteriota bacterium]
MKITIFMLRGQRGAHGRFLTLSWSAPAERSGDGAFRPNTTQQAKAASRPAGLPPHSKTHA